MHRHVVFGPIRRTGPHSRRSEAVHAPPPPQPLARETGRPSEAVASLAVSAVAAYVRGLSIDEFLDEPGLRAEVAGLLRRVAGVVDPDPARDPFARRGRLLAAPAKGERP